VRELSNDDLFVFREMKKKDRGAKERGRCKKGISECKIWQRCGFHRQGQHGYFSTWTKVSINRSSAALPFLEFRPRSTTVFVDHRYML